MDARQKLRRRLLQLVFGVLGAAAISALVYRAGPAHVLESMRTIGPWLPVVFLLEGVRLSADAFRTWLLYRIGNREVPFMRVWAAQIASCPAASLLPAGGAASEAMKAASMSPWVGAPIAAATATVNQALALIATAIASIPCVAAAYLTSRWRGFTTPIAIQALTAIGLGLIIQLTTRNASVGRLVARFSARAGEAIEGYRNAVVSLGFLPIAPIGAGVVARAVQAVELGILLRAVGGALGIRSALLTLGVHMVGGAAGDLVPGQLGVTDGSFALAADSLGIALAGALSIPLAVRGMQLVWAMVGVFIPTHRPDDSASSSI